MKLYREVKCSDYTVHKDMGGWYTKMVCHVEPYELPTEEIKEAFYDSEAFKWAKIGNTTLSANRAWDECLNYVTNLLKGER